MTRCAWTDLAREQRRRIGCCGPLVDAGLDKAAVRRIARALVPAFADKPAAPCLASRIPHFQAVTPEKLRQIETVEAALHALGFGELRVRHHGDVARIELTPADLVRAVSDPVRTQVRAAVPGGRIPFAAVDLAGVQSGAFTLPLVEVGRTMRTVAMDDDSTHPDSQPSPSSITTGCVGGDIRKPSTARARLPTRCG